MRAAELQELLRKRHNIDSRWLPGTKGLIRFERDDVSLDAPTHNGDGVMFSPLVIKRILDKFRLDWTSLGQSRLIARTQGQ
jgi:hypothetical protein